MYGAAPVPVQWACIRGRNTCVLDVRNNVFSLCGGGIPRDLSDSSCRASSRLLKDSGRVVVQRAGERAEKIVQYIESTYRGER